MTPKEKAQAIDAVTRGHSTAVEALEVLSRNSSTTKRAAAFALEMCAGPGEDKEPAARLREHMAQMFVDMYKAGFIAALEIK